MGSIASTSSVSNVTVSQTNTTTTVYNVAAATSNTEYSQVLPNNTKGFLIRSRNLGTLKMTHTNGQSGSVFLTVPGGSSYKDDNYYTNETLYFQSDRANDIIEIVAYA